jgi:anti-sigma regulatory factor (Ser/Thr protein kinase)
MADAARSADVEHRIVQLFVPGAESVVRTWPPTPRSVVRARRVLLAQLEPWGLSRLADDAALVVSELVTNAVAHARPPYRNVIATRFERLADGVRIEVHDASERMPVFRGGAPDDAASGRGLVLADALTEGQWGVRDREGPGKVVWAVLSGARPSQADRPRGARDRAAV